MNEWDIQYVEQEIIEYLNCSKSVYIDSGAANDSIVSYTVRSFKEYSWQNYEKKQVSFKTTACIFPEEIELSNYKNISTEDYKGNLFVHVEL